MTDAHNPAEPSPEFKDAFSEIVNIGVGRAAGVLNQMISSKITLRVPKVEIIDQKDLPQKMGELGNKNLATIGMSVTGDIAGMASLLFMPDGASKLVSLLTGQPQDSPDLDALKMETLNEVGNILINGVVGTLANICGMRLNYSVPNYREGSIGDVFNITDAGRVISIHTAFDVKEHLIEGRILLLFNLGAIDNLIAAINKTR